MPILKLKLASLFAYGNFTKTPNPNSGSFPFWVGGGGGGGGGLAAFAPISHRG